MDVAGSSDGFSRRKAPLVATFALLAICAADASADPGAVHAVPRADTNPTRVAAPLAPSAGEVCCACPERPCRTGTWREFAITLPIWIPGISGTFASGSTAVSASRPDKDTVLAVPDIVTEFEFALVGRVDGRIGRWVGMADVFGARIRQTADFHVDLLDVDAGFEAYVGRLLVGYRVLASERSCGCGRWDVDVLAGLRAYHAKMELDAPLNLEFDRSRTWIDPLIGVRATWDLPGRLDLRFLADIGGFGLGSDLSWSFQVQAVWCLSRHWLIELGYSWLSVDADFGANDDRFLFDLDMRGPELAITYRF